MPFVSGSNAGLALLQYAVTDVAGYPYGSGAPITAGTGAGTGVVKFAQSFGGSGQTPVRVVAKGENNRNRHEYFFNANELGEFSYKFGGFDMNAYAAFTGLKVVAGSKYNTVLTETNTAANAVQCCMIVNIDAQSSDPATFGVKGFLNRIYPLVTAVPLYATHQEVAAAEWQYNAIPTMASQYPWGVPFAQANEGATRSSGMVRYTDYPLTLDRFVGNGTITTYTLQYTPAGGTTSGYVEVYKNGTVLVPTTAWTLSGSALTFAVAPAATDIVVIVYQSTNLLSSN